MLTYDAAADIYESHRAYWAERRDRDRLSLRLYLGQYWDKADIFGANLTRVETGRGYEIVESTIASLFVREPSIVVAPDIRGGGDEQSVQAILNSILPSYRKAYEAATRNALIFPCGFLKVFPVSSPDPLMRISVAAIEPWHVIVDPAARAWEDQRWVGHIMTISVDEAKARYGKLKKMQGHSFQVHTSEQKDEAVVGEFVTIVEFYDMESDRLLVYSPDYTKRDWLYKGVKVEVGSSLVVEPGAEGEEPEPRETETYTGIPLRSASDRPVIPIIPLFLASDPETPLRGYALMERIRDQLVELTRVRSMQAQGVKKAARQYLARKGAADSKVMEIIQEGVDGEVVEINPPPGVSLAEFMIPIPNLPTPPELEVYARQLDAELARSTMMGPNQRGEAMNSTAREATILAAQASTIIGRYARERDAMIAESARVVALMLAITLGDEPEVLAPVKGRPIVLTSATLQRDYRYYALDAGSTPVMDEQRRADLERLAPMLIQLGADPRKIGLEISRLYSLPEDLIPEGAPPMAEAAGQEGV